MAFNLFGAITSGLNAYNALSNTQTGQNVIGQAKQAIVPVTQPIQKAFTPAIQTAKSAVSPITSTVSNTFIKPVIKDVTFQKKTADYYAPFKAEIEKIGITYDDLAELPEEEKQQVVSQLKQIGVQIPGLAEQEQAKIQEQAQQGEDLGVMGNIGEAIVGGFRVGEQIPRYAGNLLNLTQKYVTTPVIAGGAEMLGADKFAQKWRSAGAKFGEGAKSLGEDITKAGEGNITENQRTARRVGANIVATAPIPIKGLGLIKGSGILPTLGRGAIAGAEATPISVGLEEGRLPTIGEQAIGTVGGAVLGTVAEKLAIPGIQKGIEAVQKKINPSKFTKQIDDETVKLVRQAVRPSVSGVDTATKFDVQDAKLLQGVKEVVKQGKTPKTAKELMQAIQDTKQNIWSKVEQANKAVVKTTTGDDIATKLRAYVSDPENKTTFLSRPELKANLLKYADDVQSNKDFSNITQQELQDVLTDINSRIPASSFLKQLDANPTQTAQNTVIAKIYRDIIDDNLEKAVGTEGKEARQAYGAVRQLEKDFAKRYGVYLRQNPKGLADMFGMEGFADIAAGLLTSSPSQVIKGVAIQGAKKLIKNANNPDTIIRDIFKLQNKVKGVNLPSTIIKKNANTTLNSDISTMANTNAVKKVEGQTVTKPIVKPNTIKNESKGVTPKPKTEGVKPSPQVKPVEKRAYNSNLTESELKDATKGAKTREEYNEMAMEAGIKKINAQNEKLYKDKTISYERNGKSYNIEFDKNPDTFLLAKEMVDDAKIPYKIKENTQKIVKPVEKTEQPTEIPENVRSEYVTPYGDIKTSKIDEVFSMIKDGTTEKKGLLIKKGDRIFPKNQEAKEALKRSRIDLNDDGSVKFGILYSKENFINDIGGVKAVSQNIKPKPLSPQKTVKPLTEGKQSMGDMETKKLIEEARKAKDFASFFMKKLRSKEVNKKNLLKLGISSEQIERNTFSNGISLEDIFYELKSGKLSSYPIK